MSATLGPVPKAQFFDSDGSFLVGGKVYTYIAGTTSPLTTYTDSTGGTANANPVILDSRGEAAIWYGTGLYKIKLTDANDVEIYTVDNLSGNLAANAPVLSNVTITSGTIDGVIIGGVSPPQATFSSFSGTWEQLPAGTTMLFIQSSAPTGWTKSTAHNDKVLRIVSGGASSGGTLPFSTVFTNVTLSGSVGPHTLTVDEIPSHTHSIAVAAGGGVFSAGSGYAFTATSTTGATGGGQAHTHPFSSTGLNLAVQYVDAIIATKD